MTALIIPPADRRSLRSLAHHLDPVVMIGQNGVTAAVLHEIDNALTAHELIKVRVLGDDRDARAAMVDTICDKLSCAHVQSLGKLLLLFRPKPSDAEASRKPAVAKERPRYSDFKPSETRRRTRADADSRPKPEPARAPRSRSRSDDDPWSEIPPHVRKRVDPNYVESGYSRGRADAKPRSPRSGVTTGTKPRKKPDARAPLSPRARGTAAPMGRARSDATAADASENSATTRPPKASAEKRFRWKDREQWVPQERTPRPSTRTGAGSKRGAARSTQTRRRLREDV